MLQRGGRQATGRSALPVEGLECRHQASAVGLAHSVHDEGQFSLAALHELLDEVPAVLGQSQCHVPTVGGKLTAIDEAGRAQSVAGPAGVGGVDTQPVGHGREIQRLAGPQQDQDPHLRN